MKENERRKCCPVPIQEPVERSLVLLDKISAIVKLKERNDAIAKEIFVQC